MCICPQWIEDILLLLLLFETFTTIEPAKNKHLKVLQVFVWV